MCDRTLLRDQVKITTRISLVLECRAYSQSTFNRTPHCCTQLRFIQYASMDTGDATYYRTKHFTYECFDAMCLDQISARGNSFAGIEKMQIESDCLQDAPFEWVVYILECKDSTLYTGITNRIKTRLLAHQSGKGARYTRGRLPVKLVYIEKCGSHSDALKREHAVKKMSKVNKSRLVNSC